MPESVEGLKDDQVIYRYLTLEKFLHLVETKRLILSKVSEFEDPYEKYWLLNETRESYALIEKFKDAEEIVHKLTDHEINKLDINDIGEKAFDLVNRLYEFCAILIKHDSAYDVSKPAKAYFDSITKERDESIEENKEYYTKLENDEYYMFKHGEKWKKLSLHDRGLLHQSELTFVTCWNLGEGDIESDGLWRTYSPSKNGVRIKTTVGKLKSGVHPYSWTVWLNN